MTRLISILCLILVASCAPKAIIVEPITPAVTEAKGQVRAATAATSRTQQRAAETAQRVTEVRYGIEDAITHADHVRTSKAPGSPEAVEWEAQWKLLTEIRTRNLFAETSANSTVTQSKEAQSLADAASKGMDSLETHAEKTDKNTAEITTENIKLGQDAGMWRMIALLVIGFLLLTAFLRLFGAAIWTAIKAHNPLSRI